MQLIDQSIVIVGGTSGIGLSAARACLDAAARGIVIVGRDDAAAAETESAFRLAGVLSDRVIVRRGDASLSTIAQQAIDVALQQFGRFDALLHVAGGSGRRAGDGPLHSISDEGWSHTIGQNLDSLFFSNRAAASTFLRLGHGGSVLNIGSVLAESPSPRFFATHAYAAAKSAAVGLTRAAAAYYAPAGIRFNLLAPGLVQTPMSERATRDSAIVEYIRRKQPLDGGRLATPADLDAAIVYFLSPASRWVTGQVLAIDGGWSVTDAAASVSSFADAIGAAPPAEEPS